MYLFFIFLFSSLVSSSKCPTFVYPTVLCPTLCRTNWIVHRAVPCSVHTDTYIWVLHTAVNCSSPRSLAWPSQDSSAHRLSSPSSVSLQIHQQPHSQEKNPFTWYTNFSHRKLTGKLNPGFPRQKQQWTKSRLFYRRIRLKIYETSEMLYLEPILFGAATWTLQKVRRSQTLCKFCSVVLERMEKINWTDRVRNEEVLHTVEKTRLTYTKRKEGRLTEVVISCVGTAY